MRLTALRNPTKMGRKLKIFQDTIPVVISNYVSNVYVEWPGKPCRNNEKILLDLGFKVCKLLV